MLVQCRLKGDLSSGHHTKAANQQTVAMDFAGILNHTQEDAEGRLLDGLQWLVPQ